MYNTTVYNSYKNEAERKGLALVDDLGLVSDGKTIQFKVTYKDTSYLIESYQLNNKHLCMTVYHENSNPIEFSETTDFRGQSLLNLLNILDSSKVSTFEDFKSEESQMVPHFF